MTMRSFRHVIVAIYIHSYFRETWTMDGTREEKKKLREMLVFPDKEISSLISWRCSSNIYGRSLRRHCPFCNASRHGEVFGTEEFARPGFSLTRSMVFEYL